MNPQKNLYIIEKKHYQQKLSKKRHGVFGHDSMLKKGTFSSINGANVRSVKESLERDAGVWQAPMIR